MGQREFYGFPVKVGTVDIVTHEHTWEPDDLSPVMFGAVESRPADLVDVKAEANGWGSGGWVQPDDSGPARLDVLRRIGQPDDWITEAELDIDIHADGVLVQPVMNEHGLTVYLAIFTG